MERMEAALCDAADRQPTWRKALALIVIVLVIVVSAVWRFRYISPWIRGYDEVDFALALDRFDLLAMQPHFPGYPYFILGGTLVHRWVANPVTALGLFNTAMTLLAGWPVYKLGRCKWGPVPSLVLAVAVLSPAYMSVLAAQPMSEASAVAVLWWYLWSLRRGLTSPSPFGRWLQPLALFGLLMGVRVSYAPFGLGLALLAWRDRTERPAAYPRAWAALLAVGAFFQAIWVSALVSSEGSIRGFWTLSMSFLYGHFEEWGGSAVSSPVLWPHRIWLFLGHNGWWTGLSGCSWLASCTLAALIALLAGRLIAAARRREQTIEGDRPNRVFLRWLGWMLAAYALWALFGQNIEKPRHIVPLIGGLMFLLGWGTFSIRSRAATVLLLLAVGVQLWNGAALVREQAQEKPAVQQLADAMSRLREPFTLYTWDESRVLSYDKVGFNHVPILTYALFQEQLRVKSVEPAYVTNHVLEGFAAQGIDTSGQVELVGEFRSNPIFEPVYNDIRLYEWVGQAGLGQPAQ